MPVKIFYCYAHEDEPLLMKLKSHLRPLQRQGLIDVWHDCDIKAGTEWEKEISKHLNTADIILLLVSPDFMDSDYCYSIEMMRAMDRHEHGEAQVIPIILRPVYWKDAPFGKLQALPKNAKPITSRYWHNRDEAFFVVAEGIYIAIKELDKSPDKLLKTHASPTNISQVDLLATSQNDTTSTLSESQKKNEKWLNDGNNYFLKKQFQKALDEYNRVIQADPAYTSAYYNRGLAYSKIKQYEEACADYNRVIQLDPKYIYAHINKGIVLYNLERYSEALAAFEEAIRLDLNNASAYKGKGSSLFSLKHYTEALSAFEQAKILDSSYTNLYAEVVDVLEVFEIFERSKSTEYRFDKFTERARIVFMFAQEEAQRFQHNYIGTEHILLGLIREGKSVANKVLSNCGVELNKVRSAVEYIIGLGDHIVLGELGLTPRSKTVVMLAVAEAHLLHDKYIGTEHLLLGLVDEGESIAAGILESLGLNLDKVRTQIIQVRTNSLGQQVKNAIFALILLQDKMEQSKQEQEDGHLAELTKREKELTEYISILESTWFG